ncbi:carbohydrate esterase family 3 protein [Cercospora zeae-maydis SCOH1-5]|uniref:Carbohydrate esterase family 3 protein n=1 Tax=Cercospora zeae-maydis SCOH1-5 TaxID=717836 RepID=A0A6A6FVL6_9PEZI|nr:carbohydrate esterase family 3 protein [Cercospora zeae-maydis SCOH1-5]
MALATTESQDQLRVQDDQSKKHRKILILGDSITHGGEGDYTWRYRLWQWCKQETSISFVGPYTGVKGPDPPNIPHPAPLPGEDDPYNHPAVHIPWGYAHDVDEDFRSGSRHFATWGYQAFQCKDTIADVVRAWQPDLILSLLGFNDVGWWVSDADGTLNSVHTIVERTRAVKPDVDFALGNIVNRTYMEGRDDLLENTKRFNDMLPIKAREWSKRSSRVVAVDVAKHYDCGPQYRDWAPAAYDGLHPSSLGEFQIAQAFSEALHREFGLGRKTLEVPKNVPRRDLHDPKNIVSKSTPMGISVTWQGVFGAAYEIRHRERNGSWSVFHSNSPRIDIETARDSRLELQIRCTHGFEHGPWSRVCRCACIHPPMPAPTHIRTRPIPGGFAISWEAPHTERVIAQYEVLYKDDDRGDAFPSLQGALGVESEIQGLPEGDVIEWIMVRGWCLRKKGGNGLMRWGVECVHPTTQSGCMENGATEEQ